jgi:hypothetical protein
MGNERLAIDFSTHMELLQALGPNVDDPPLRQRSLCRSNYDTTGDFSLGELHHGYLQKSSTLLSAESDPTDTGLRGFESTTTTRRRGAGLRGALRGL